MTNWRDTLYILWSDTKVNRKGKEAADKSSARPGASEHQTGLAFDLNTITTSFKDTAEGKWVNQNCFNYGYIIRYPENKTNETGYIFEPWHIRYVGNIANYIYNNNQFFGIYITKTAIICGDGCWKLHHSSIVVVVYVYLKSRFNLTFQTIRIGF